MPRRRFFYPTWVLLGGLGWALAWGGARSLTGGLTWGLFIDTSLAVAVGVSLLVAATLQWLLLRRIESSILLWLAATEIGYWGGFPVAMLGWIIAMSGQLGLSLASFLTEVSPLFGWLYWPAFVFVATGIGGIPGGLLSGLLYRRALRRGTLWLWIFVSMGAWIAAFGVTGVTFAGLMYPTYFFLDQRAVETVPLPAEAAAVGGLAGLAHAAILGLYVAKVLDETPFCSNAEAPTVGE